MRSPPSASLADTRRLDLPGDPGGPDSGQGKSGAGGRGPRKEIRLWTIRSGDQAVLVFAADLAAQRVPSIRGDLCSLHVGQARAQRLRNYLAAGALRRAQSPAA